MGFFEKMQEMPPDPIFGVAAAFKADRHPDKCSFLIGYYRDENLKTPLLSSVAEVEKRLLEAGDSREYLPIEGDEEFLVCAQKLVFGKTDERIAKIQTVGGTGALYLSGLLAKNWTEVIAISKETWANHWKIFSQAGLKTLSYPYYGQKELIFEEMLTSLQGLKEKSAVLLHACCHNPTGFDLSEEQWKRILELVEKKRLFPILDMAYQGFAVGLEEDALAPRLFLDRGVPFAVTYTFAKNASLYGERAGALFVITGSKKEAQVALSHLKQMARTTYSNPPMHPASVIKGILSDAALFARWQEEICAMRKRMQSVRASFVEKMEAKDPEGGWSALLQGSGLFAMTGLGKEAILRLREENGVYIGGEGRINLTGLHPKNLDLVTDAIAGCR